MTDMDAQELNDKQVLLQLQREVLEGLCPDCEREVDPHLRFANGTLELVIIKQGMPSVIVASIDGDRVLIKRGSQTLGRPGRVDFFNQLAFIQKHAGCL